MGREVTREEVSKLLKQIKNPITYIYTPTNLGQEKTRFFQNDTYEPQFKYEKPKNNNLERVKELKDITKITDVPSEVEAFYLKLISQKEISTRMCLEVGDNMAVTKYTTIKHGYPSERLFNIANDILNGNANGFGTVMGKNREGDLINSDQIIQILNKALLLLNLDGWTVKYSKKERSTGISVSITDREIILGSRNIVKSKNEVRKTIVHEIGTHVFRYVNGLDSGIAELSKQNLFSYIVAEEGLATYNESISGLLTQGSLKSKARSLYAVYKGRDISFRSLYNDLIGQGLGERQAFNLCVRVKRGISDTSRPGINTKSMVYLQGYIEILEAISKDPSVYEKLYAGKLPLELVFWVDRGYINRPKLLFKVSEFEKIFTEIGI